ncbi:MAG: DNA repair protein RadC [Dehalococcoidia bacterium]|nr:DNA repair protein RadC [Dehalococcoidia bacterium]
MKDSFTVRDLPPAERPRERLARFGAEALSAQEILALVLGRGVKGESVMVTAQRLLSRFASLQGIADASLEELSQINGIGPAKAAQLKAAFDLSRRLQGGPGEGKAQVKSPEDVFGVVSAALKGKKKEHFLALLLDTRNRLIRTATVSVGSLDSSIVHPREVFKEAIKASAASVIFVHNHPSGDPEPSQDDIELTRRLVEAGKLLGILVLDHVIVGDGSFLSLKASEDIRFG